MHTFVFITNCIGDPACITYSFMMKLLVALIALVVTGFFVLVVVCGLLHPCWVLGLGSYLSWMYGPVWWCNLVLPVCGQLGLINCQRCFLDFYFVGKDYSNFAYMVRCFEHLMSHYFKFAQSATAPHIIKFASSPS